MRFGHFSGHPSVPKLMSFHSKNTAYKSTAWLVILMMAAGILPQLSMAECSKKTVADTIINDDSVPLICDATDILLCDLTENPESGCLKQTFAVFTVEKKPKLPVSDFDPLASVSNASASGLAAHTSYTPPVTDTGPAAGFSLRAPPFFS